MNTREWALIFFTILTQLAVGSFIVLGIVQFFAARRVGEAQADKLSDRALIAIGPILVLGLVASLGHLGNPLSAPRAITNLGTSWLSREILLSVTFTVLGAVFAYMQWKKIATPLVRRILALVTAIVGLAVIYSMAGIYMLRTIPVWNTFVTALAFYTTAFQLGTLAVGTAFYASYTMVLRKDPGCEEAQCDVLHATIRGIAIAALVLLGVQIVTLPLLVGHLTAIEASAADQSAVLLFNSFSAMLILRLVLAFIGAGLFSLFLYKNADGSRFQRALGYVVYGAFALVLVSELVGRYLFYASQIRLGV